MVEMIKQAQKACVLSKAKMAIIAQINARTDMMVRSSCP